MLTIAMPAEGRHINSAISSRSPAARVGAGMQATPLFPNVHDDSPSILMMDSGFFDLRNMKAGKKSGKPQEKKAPTTKKEKSHEDLPHHLWFS